MSLIAGGCLIGATPRGQPRMPAMMLPHGYEGLRVRRRTVLWTFRRPFMSIRMKLSADSLHEDESFALVLQTVTEDLRRGPSFAHRLGRQTFGSLTGLL